MSAEGMMQAMQDIGTLAQYGGGQSLKTELPAGEYVALQAMLKKRGLPAGSADGTRPWMLFLTLATPACEQLRQAQGLKVLDFRLAEDAKARGIPVVGLETLESQFRALASISTWSQLTLLVSAARPGLSVEDGLETLVRGYLRRDLGFLWPLQHYLYEKASLPRSAVEELRVCSGNPSQLHDARFRPASAHRGRPLHRRRGRAPLRERRHGRAAAPGGLRGNRDRVRRLGAPGVCASDAPCTFW